MPPQVTSPSSVQATVSSAEILALFTTPKEIVAAPGTGKLLLPFACSTELLFGTTPYTKGPGAIGSLAIIYSGSPEDSSADLMVDDGIAGGIFTQSADTVGRMSGNAGSNVRADAENKGLSLYTDTDDPTLGDGTLVVTVIYHIIELF